MTAAKESLYHCSTIRRVNKRITVGYTFDRPDYPFNVRYKTLVPGVDGKRATIRVTAFALSETAAKSTVNLLSAAILKYRAGEGK